MNLDTKRREYKFKNSEDAFSFADDMSKAGYKGAVVRKSLPEFKGHANPGFSVWYRARTIFDDMQVSKLYMLTKENRP